MNSPVRTNIDFSTFVLELNQCPETIECAADGSAACSGSRRCCPPESRLSQEFESKMQKLMSNYDLGDDSEGVMVPVPALVKGVQPENGAVEIDTTCSMDKDDSLETTIDNEDDPLELTGEELDDSGDAGDGCSSDEQQQSRSLSLSYSLSISHAQENYSQYSQSTDKGLSKRYDSPCSYEDDRESECTNFDKLDDWNDFISDMHNNNNNNGDNANRDFREYYDEYLAAKGQNGSSTSGVGTSEEGTNDGCNTKETEHSCDESTEMHERAEGPTTGRFEYSRPDTPAYSRNATSATEKCRTFLEYRSPADEYEDDPMLAAVTDDNSNLLVSSDDLDAASASRQPSSSGKRKLDQDRDDVEYQVSIIYEKFHKTEAVPDRGYHPPLINDEQFKRLNLIESPSKTPIPRPVENIKEALYCPEDYQTDEELVRLDGEEEECAVATTPTNPNNSRHMFRSLASDALNDFQPDDINISQLPVGRKQWYSKKHAARSQNATSNMVAGPSHVSRDRSNLCLGLNSQQ